ncbi:MAG: ATP synthase subunit I [bacterium]|nr:ATP synthase subunit I [bacterium]
MIRLLKKADRILLEMHTGMILYGAVCQTVGFFLAKDQIRYAQSLWFGILFAAVNCVHMARTLDRALPRGEDAAKAITRGYVFRYLMLIVVLGAVSLTGVLDTLIVFLGYMGMKITAYLQPLTHKFFNKLFCETDPVPEAVSGEEGETPGEESREV